MVDGYLQGVAETSLGPMSAAHLRVCSGADMHTLCNGRFRRFDFLPCKLRMLRTAPLSGGRRLGPMPAAGLTLRHYKSFEGCLSLPELRARIARERPQFDRYGIHVMASQNAMGELILGDSHEYGDAIEPFDKAEIDGLILDYLATVLNEVPEVVARWHGIYAKHPEKPYVIAEGDEGVTAINGVGGAGMPRSFGLAAKVVAEVLGPGPEVRG